MAKTDNYSAVITGLKPGTLDWSIKDAHIYVNQIEGIKEQIRITNIIIFALTNKDNSLL